MKPIVFFLIFYFFFHVHLFSVQEWKSFQNGGKLQNNAWQLPNQWSPTHITWMVNLSGYGQSTPVVFKQTVFVTSVTGGNKETLNLEAFQIKDGKKRWSFSQPNSSPEENTFSVSRAAPTPVTDEQGVIAFFEGGNLIALNHEGKLRWRRDLRSEYGEIKARHGLAGSIEQNKKDIFIWCERMSEPYVIAIDKATGQTVWKKPGLGSTSWSSPRLIKIAGQEQLVLSAIGIIVGMDPNNGERQWAFREIVGNSSATPMPVGDSKFLIGSSGPSPSSKQIPSCGVISVKKVKGEYQVDWEWAAEKATSSFGSPVSFDGKAFFVNRNGTVHCYDLKSGENIYTDRLSSGSIWATPLGTKEHLYFFGKDGVTSILRSGSTFIETSSNALWKKNPKSKKKSVDQKTPSRFAGPVLYAAAIAGKGLLLRRGERLYYVK